MAIRGFVGGGSTDRTTSGGKAGTSNPKNTATKSAAPKKAKTAQEIASSTQAYRPTPGAQFGPGMAGSGGAANGAQFGTPGISGPIPSPGLGMGGMTNAAGTPTLRSTGGLNQGTTDPITGGIADYGYTPQGLGDIYAHPEWIAQDILDSLGINNPGLAEILGQQLDPAVAANLLINKGMGSSATDTGTMNFANDYMTQLVTPNGRTVDYDYLLNALMGSSATNPSASPLGAYLAYDNDGSALTPDEQVRRTNALASQTLVGLNPYAQQAYMGALGHFGSDYGKGIAKGDPASSGYASYLAASPLKNWIKG